MMDRQRITFDPEVLAGQACIRGMRMPVATIVRCIACGMSRAEILRDYPDLEDEDISASLEYAAALTEDQVIPTA